MSDTGPVRPVVYLGPSAPAEDIRAALPEAVIRPPLRRGDLYRDRMLRFSAFLVIDGVFSQEDAVPPREVVDVLRDGALVLGAASMGALRATDCAPAGAIGTGLVYRLFSAGVLSSEDEVAVMFDPDAPFPALSESLVNMRVALRRAVRAGALDRDRAAALAAAGRGLHFSRRGWAAAFRAAGLRPLWPELRPVLAAQDAKRSDAGLAARLLARMLRDDPRSGHRPRLPGAPGRAGAAREREADPLRGHAEAAASIDFVHWMLAGGRAARYLENPIDMLHVVAGERLDSTATGRNCQPSLRDPVYDRLSEALRRAGEFEAEWFRHIALDLAEREVSTASAVSVRLAEAHIAAEHGVADWDDVLNLSGDAAALCHWARNRLAKGVDWRRSG